MKFFLTIIAFLNSIVIFTHPTYSVPFDSNHCKRKCESLFLDSPTKKSLCLGTCSNGFFERKKIVYMSDSIGKYNKEKLSKCLANCSKDVNSATDFKLWTKCRKSCIISENSNNPSQTNYIPFELDDCNAECDRYWKGTVHWEPCQQQCQTFEKKYSEQQKISSKFNENDQQNPQKAILYDIW